MLLQGWEQQAPKSGRRQHRGVADPACWGTPGPGPMLGMLTELLEPAWIYCEVRPLQCSSNRAIKSLQSAHVSARPRFKRPQKKATSMGNVSCSVRSPPPALCRG